MTIGVWCGRVSLENPERDVAFCSSHGIERIDIIVNDHSKWRKSQPFSLFKNGRGKILKLAKEARRNGIEVHLMSWLMPHRSYIAGAADILIPLCEETEAKSLQWDAEEPWMLAKKRMTYDDAASLIADKFVDLPCIMAANAIGHAPKSKFGPLAGLCSYVVPQCYSTRTQPIAPEKVVSKIVRRWKSHRGLDLPQMPMTPGLAAYRQLGIPGHTIETAMVAAFADAINTSDTGEVIYWSLDHIRRQKRVARVIRELA